jgi:hypothetical protein
LVQKGEGLMSKKASEFHEFFSELDEELKYKAIELAKENRDKISINYLKLKLGIGMIKSNLLLEFLKEKDLID